MKNKFQTANHADNDRGINIKIILLFTIAKYKFATYIYINK